MQVNSIFWAAIQPLNIADRTTIPHLKEHIKGFQMTPNAQMSLVKLLCYRLILPLSIMPLAQVHQRVGPRRRDISACPCLVLAQQNSSIFFRISVLKFLFPFDLRPKCQNTRLMEKVQIQKCRWGRSSFGQKFIRLIICRRPTALRFLPFPITSPPGAPDRQI